MTPEDPYRLPQDLHAVIDGLTEIGFITAPLPDPGAAFLLGENFMQWVTFMGCSPFIRLEPGDDGEPYCHLVIDGPYDRPRLLQGRNTTPPRCAACRKRIDAWREAIGHLSQAVDVLAACPHCGHRQDPATFDWRQSAGCGRLFLQVENIFPQEAVPSPGLMERLRGMSGDLPWRHFYLQDPIALIDLDAPAT